MNDTFVRNEKYGGLAQLARAPALQAGGQRFESVYLHHVTQKVTRANGLINWPPSFRAYSSAG